LNQEYTDTVKVIFSKLFAATVAHIGKSTTGNVLIVSDSDFGESWKKIIKDTFDKNKRSYFPNAHS
jgi:hypothetical protein